VHEGKDYGLIVDYYGVIDHLDQALEVYTASKEDLKAHLESVLTDIDKGWQSLDQLHSQLWETFKQVRNKGDQEAMEKAVADPEVRQDFYVRLSRFARTLKLATASVDFHEQTPAEKIDRYRHDLRYFMGLRASVARRYAESIDFKQYQAAIQKLLDTYVGAGEVETIVEPVDIFDREAFRRELDQRTSAEGQAEVIANRVRKTITEHMQEDPVFYQRFSELIDQTLREYTEQRFEQLELLRRMNDIADRVRDRRTFEEVPERLRDKDVAKAYFDIVQQQLGESKVTLAPDVAVEAALMIDSIVRAKRKVDWTLDMDVQNQMRTAIEDELFALKAKHGLDIGFDAIDSILDRCIDVAKRRMP
jgi:type I restriction enzyme R subunit